MKYEVMHVRLNDRTEVIDTIELKECNTLEVAREEYEATLKFLDENQGVLLLGIDDTENIETIEQSFQSVN